MDRIGMQVGQGAASIASKLLSSAQSPAPQTGSSNANTQTSAVQRGKHHKHGGKKHTDGNTSFQNALMSAMNARLAANTQTLNNIAQKVGASTGVQAVGGKGGA